MKRIISCILLAVFMASCTGCVRSGQPAQVVTTTMPVYNFTSAICHGTDIQVEQLITEDISCLHEYTLQVSQMQALEAAQVVVISGAGLEDFMHDLLANQETVIDASAGIPLLCSEHNHSGHDHDHEEDPHIWLSPVYAKAMAENICDGLCTRYPQHEAVFRENLSKLSGKLDQLYDDGIQAFEGLENRDLITFHNGFAYFAQCFGLTVLHSVEEESGSEISAAQLIHLITLAEDHQLKAVFAERNGSSAAAGIVARELNIPVYTLDMGISSDDYFETMYHNIQTVKEALE